MGDRRAFLTNLDLTFCPKFYWRWPDELKTRVVMGALENGVCVRDVAKRYDLRPNHLADRRCLARDGKLVLPAQPIGVAPMFVQMIVDRKRRIIALVYV
ncbi:transposase [Actibacterium sp. 188UL27-1]|uniref:transposase n=1 Tax=Actibacterium sp. 188UL27-1 TaxID=2786961 RepID=UPI00195CBBD5|nr:transposase [Actibacterium sp. 188UL27-1]MBM7068872.1 transposase [Actibacterium sp. 188UL27-1]